MSAGSATIIASNARNSDGADFAGRTTSFRAVNGDAFYGAEASAPVSIEIPQAPAAMKHSKAASTSSLGCLGGNANQAHDDAIINQYLSGASAATPVMLMLDQFLTTKGITVSANGYTSIVGFDRNTGFRLADNTNTLTATNNAYNGNVISCGAVRPADPGGVVPPRTAKHVRLANFRIDGNNANNVTPFQFGIDIVSVQGVEIENVVIEHASSYSVRLSNVEDVRIINCNFYPYLPSETINGAHNRDGIHVNGPSNRILIQGCRLNTDDDAIAFNCPEGFRGNITNVMVSNCDFVNSSSFMRFYPCNTFGSYQIQNVLVADCIGVNPGLIAIRLGDGAGAALTTDAIHNVTFRNLAITGARYPFSCADNIGLVDIEGFRWISPPTNAQGVLTATDVKNTIRSLSLKDCKIYRAFPKPFCLVDLANGINGSSYAGLGAAVQSLHIDGVTVLDEPGVDGGNLWVVSAGGAGTTSVIHDLVIDNLDPKIVGITQTNAQITNTSCFNGSVRGGAALGMAACFDSFNQFTDYHRDMPDSAMGNGTPYFSATQFGALCVKRAGIVHKMVST